VMQNGGQYATVLTNGSAEPVRCVLLHRSDALHGTRIWGAERLASEREFELGPRQTLVDLWR
jgi:hypothetical protein